jgi:hypothetical protein
VVTTLSDSSQKYRQNSLLGSAIKSGTNAEVSK